MQIKIGVIGVAGRMGRAVVKCLTEQPELFELTEGCDHPSPDVIGQDIGQLAGIGTNGIAIKGTADMVFSNSQVVIEFANSEATVSHVKLAMMTGIPLIIGTTGFSERQLAAIKSSSERVPIVMASNYSLGVTLAEALVEQAARILGTDWDIEIVEMHHRNKIDAPSGTALSLGLAAAKGRGVELEEVAVRGRDGLTGARKPGTIGFASLRGGEVIGDHTVIFSSLGEQFEVTHKAFDRMIFARGALVAAKWVIGRKPGLYSMRDVLGLI